MPVTVDGSLCGGFYQHANQACTSVTICQHGTSNCQTISNILVDTGSSGLRIFKSVITIPTDDETSGAGTLSECFQYHGHETQWGPVETVDVVLGNEGAVQIPMLAIDSTYATPPGPCTSAQSNPETGPDQTWYNGVLGVGLFKQDCGSNCATYSLNGQYYSCTGTTCSGATASLAMQVQNPVSLLPVDNNGVILALPPVPIGGVLSLDGSLILGIGTQANNTPSGVTPYTADSNGEFTTVFSDYSASAIPSTIDSSIRLLVVPEPTANNLPDCSSPEGGSYAQYAGLLCPSSTLSFSATNFSASGPNSGAVSFQIGNAVYLYQTPSAYVFVETGEGTGGNNYFVWGMPFFFGRRVYVGIEGTSSSLGVGPYWAY